MTGRLLLLVVLYLLCLTTFADVAADEIHSLPGWDGPLPSRQWSGYLTFNKSKHMHYWLVESENDPANDPLVVWLNGGPGCSSLDGFIYEHGPFRLDSTNKKLVKWEYSWAKLANMIYLESPVGVGFSYSDNPNDYNTNDNKSSQDNLHAIETFFESFPRFKSHKFFIAGESYGGVYVPTFAEAIMWAINNGTYKGARPLGIAVGNGCSGNDIGVCGNDRTKYDMLYFLRSSLMSDTMKKDITNACGNFDNISPTCQNLVNTFSNAISDIDVYNIYGDCINGDGQRMPFGNNTVTKIPRKNSGVGAPGPAWCINSFAASDYFNQPEVQAAIHVKKPPYYWSVCANQINYDQNRANLPRDTYPALNKFLRVVVYNGDWDACVPYTDGEAWTKGMGYPAIKTWQPWYFTDNSLPGASNKQQVGGFSTVYQTPYHFSFITVKGGRHEVPETAPRQAFEMIRRLLTGEEF